MSDRLLKSLDEALDALPRDLLGHMGDENKEVLCKDRKALRQWIKKRLRFVLEALGEDRKAAGILADRLPEPCFWVHHKAEKQHRRARDEWNRTFFRKPAVWLWALWWNWEKRTNLPAVSGLPDWPGLDHLSQPEPSGLPADTATEGATPSQHFLALVTLVLYASIKNRPGEVLDYLRRALEDVKADLALVESQPTAEARTTKIGFHG